MLHGISTSDWHLDALKSHFPADHIQRQLTEIEKMYKYAIEKDIQYVFVNGDIFDGSTSPTTTYEQLIRLLAKYDKYVTTYYIAGNHDWSNVNKTALDFLEIFPELEMLKNFHVFKAVETKKIEGIKVNFIPHGTTEAPKSKTPALNFLHQAVAGVVGDNGRKIKVNDDDDFTCSKKDFSFTGHVHAYQVIEGRRIVNNGAPYQKTFGETSPKGFVEFRAEMKGKKLKVVHQFVNLKPEFELRTVVVEKQKDFKKLTNSYNVRLRVIVSGDVNIPSDLTRVYPNIAAVLDTKGKKVKESESSLKLSRERVETIPDINPTKGLQKALKKLGHTKSEIKFAKTIVEQALA